MPSRQPKAPVQSEVSTFMFKWQEMRETSRYNLSPAVEPLHVSVDSDLEKCDEQLCEEVQVSVVL